jgi:hypothetical protein
MGTLGHSGADAWRMEWHGMRELLPRLHEISMFNPNVYPDEIMQQQQHSTTTLKRHRNGNRGCNVETQHGGCK